MRRARSLSDRVELDIAFHRRLVEASGLSPLLTFSNLLAVFFRKFRESLRHADWEAGIESHQRLIDALRAGRLAAAREELQQHMKSHSSGWRVDRKVDLSNQVALVAARLGEWARRSPTRWPTAAQRVFFGAVDRRGRSKPRPPGPRPRRWPWT